MRWRVIDPTWRLVANVACIFVSLHLSAPLLLLFIYLFISIYLFIYLLYIISKWFFICTLVWLKKRVNCVKCLILFCWKKTNLAFWYHLLRGPCCYSIMQWSWLLVDPKKFFCCHRHSSLNMFSFIRFVWGNTML